MHSILRILNNQSNPNNSEVSNSSTSRSDWFSTNSTSNINNTNVGTHSEPVYQCSKKLQNYYSSPYLKSIVSLVSAAKAQVNADQTENVASHIPNTELELPITINGNEVAITVQNKKYEIRLNLIREFIHNNTGNTASKGENKQYIKIAHNANGDTETLSLTLPPKNNQQSDSTHTVSFTLSLKKLSPQETTIDLIRAVKYKKYVEGRVHHYEGPMLNGAKEGKGKLIIKTMNYDNGKEVCSRSTTYDCNFEDDGPNDNDGKVTYSDGLGMTEYQGKVSGYEKFGKQCKLAHYSGHPRTLAYKFEGAITYEEINDGEIRFRKKNGILRELHANKSVSKEYSGAFDSYENKTGTAKETIYGLNQKTNTTDVKEIYTGNFNKSRHGQGSLEFFSPEGESLGVLTGKFEQNVCNNGTFTTKAYGGHYEFNGSFNNGLPIFNDPEKPYTIHYRSADGKLTDMGQVSLGENGKLLKKGSKTEYVKYASIIDINWIDALVEEKKFSVEQVWQVNPSVDEKAWGLNTSAGWQSNYTVQ